MIRLHHGMVREFAAIFKGGEGLKVQKGHFDPKLASPVQKNFVRDWGSYHMAQAIPFRYPVKRIAQ